MDSNEEIAKDFMMWGICEWGQDEATRAKVTASYLKAKGFDVEESGFPIFGGMFPQQPIRGKDADAAFEWLRAILDKLQRGKFELEVKQLEDALQGGSAPHTN